MITRITTESFFAKALFAITLLLVFMGSLAAIGSDDSFMNLTLGRHLLTEGHLPPVDPYLFSIPDYHWHVWHEWLSYVYYYALYCVGGFAGIIVARGLFLSLFAYFFWRFSDEQKKIPPVILSITILSIFTVAFERCRVDRACFFGDIFLSILILLLLAIDRAGRPLRWIWLLPVLFLVWVNFHPSYPLGWIFIGIFVALRFKKWTAAERTKWFTVSVLCLLVTLLNPLGLDGALYPIKAYLFYDFAKFKEINTEWVPTFSGPLFEIGTKLRVGLFLVLGLIVTARGLRQKRWFEFLGTLVFVYFCCSSIRFVSIAAFGIGAFILNDMRTWAWPSLDRGVAAAARIVHVVMTAAFLFCEPSYGAWWPSAIWKGQWFLPHVPISAVRFMATLPPGNIFNGYSMGGLLAWELKGKMKIAGHGHIDQPNLSIQHYWRYVKSPQDFRDIIGNGNVEYFLVSKFDLRAHESGWVQELTKYWLMIYSDDVAVIFKRIYQYR